MKSAARTTANQDARQRLIRLIHVGKRELGLDDEWLHAVSYIEVLDAERSLFSTKQNILDLIYARQVNEINLFTALGGGWVE